MGLRTIFTLIQETATPCADLVHDVRCCLHTDVLQGMGLFRWLVVVTLDTNALTNAGDGLSPSASAFAKVLAARSTMMRSG